MARTGRPTKPAPATGGGKVSLGLKVTREIKNKLDNAARVSGRTQSQEAEGRLERSFERQELLFDVLTAAYGPQAAGLLVVAGEALRLTAVTAMVWRGEAEAGADYSEFALDLSDPEVYRAAIDAVGLIFNFLIPTAAKKSSRELPDTTANRIATSILAGLMRPGTFPAKRRTAEVRLLLGPLAPAIRDVTIENTEPKGKKK